MEIYNRIKTLAKSRNVTITGLEAELGFSRGSLSKIDKNRPSSEKVQKLADYFGVTQTYILNGDECSDHVELTTKNNHENRILLSFRGAGKLTDEEYEDLQNMFEATLDVYLKARGKKKQ